MHRSLGHCVGVEYGFVFLSTVGWNPDNYWGLVVESEGVGVLQNILGVHGGSGVGEVEERTREEEQKLEKIEARKDLIRKTCGLDNVDLEPMSGKE